MLRSLSFGLLLLVSACSDAAEPPIEMRIDGLIARTELETYIGAGSYRVFLTVHNDTPGTIEVNWAGPCLVKPRLYRDDRMVFDGVAAFSNCPDEVNTYRLPSGFTYERIWGFIIDVSMLGDSIPRGEYRIVAAVRPQGKTGRIYEIHAGTRTF